MLNIENLHVSLRGKEILHGVNLHIPKGEVHALFGPNGSGKSVLIMTIMGYPGYEITQGRILFDNHDLAGLPIDERVKLGIGLAEQRPPTIKGVTLRRLFDLLTSASDEKKAYADAMLAEFGIERFLERKINDGLSGGEIKRSELFLALMAQPTFLLLDEPDSGVDPEHLKQIAEMINEALRNKQMQSDLPHARLRRNTGLIVTHSATILNVIHTDKAHVMVNGVMKCTGNSGILMDQIHEHGYEYCIRCHQEQGAEQ